MQNLTMDDSYTYTNEGDDKYDAIFNSSKGLFITFCVVIVSAFICNALVLSAVLWNPHLRTAMNVYVVNLAISDLMVVGLESPLIMTQFLLDSTVSSRILSKKTCILAYFFNTLAGASSVITLLALSVERYLMVMYPLQARYIAHRAKIRAISIVLFVWSLTILMHLGQCFLYGSIRNVYYASEDGQETYNRTFCLSALNDDDLAPWESHLYAATVFCLIYGSTFTITLVLYIKIIWFLWKRRKPQLHKTSSSDSSCGRKSSSRVSNIAANNTIRIFTFSVICYVCCYSTYFYVNFYYVYFGLFPNNGLFMIALANLLGAINSLINPILSAIFLHQFRHAILEITTCGYFCGLFPKFRNRHPNRRTVGKSTSSSCMTHKTSISHASTREFSDSARVRSDTLPLQTCTPMNQLRTSRTPSSITL